MKDMSKELSTDPRIVVEGFLTTGVADTTVVCADNEYRRLAPPSGQTCESYMRPYINTVGGYLSDPSSTSNCSYCPIRDTNTFLGSVSAKPSHMWRNLGFMWGYIVFNIVAAIFFYWLARVPKGDKNKVKEVASGGEPPKPVEGEVEKVLSSGD